MVAIATLIDICEQKFIAKTLQDREKNINILSFNGKSFFLFVRNFLLLFAMSSVSFAGADIRVVSFSTVRIYVTYIASSAALAGAWGHK